MTKKVFAFANQKGGVGKTTSCVNLAASLVASKQRVLVIDLDPQGNATMGSGVDKGSLEISINDFLKGQGDLEDFIVPQTPAGYDLVGSNSDLTQAEVLLLKKENQEKRLATSLSKMLDRYDYIFMDCPPSLNMLTINALSAADGVVIPMQCEYYALEGLTDLLNTVRQLQTTLNPDLEVFGIIRTMFDGRNRLCGEVSAQLIEHFGNKVFQTVIARNVRLAEAPSYGLPVLLYDRHSRGAAAYLALAGEFLRRNQQKPAPLQKNAKESEGVLT